MPRRLAALYLVSTACTIGCAIEAAPDDFGKRRDPVITRERKNDPGRIAQFVQRVHERPQRPIEPEDLIVDLPGIRPEAVADIIGGRERDRENIGLRTFSQIQALQPLEAATA